MRRRVTECPLKRPDTPSCALMSRMARTTPNQEPVYFANCGFEAWKRILTRSRGAMRVLPWEKREYADLERGGRAYGASGQAAGESAAEDVIETLLVVELALPSAGALCLCLRAHVFARSSCAGFGHRGWGVRLGDGIFALDDGGGHPKASEWAAGVWKGDWGCGDGCTGVLMGDLDWDGGIVRLCQGQQAADSKSRRGSGREVRVEI